MDITILYGSTVTLSDIVAPCMTSETGSPVYTIDNITNNIVSITNNLTYTNFTLEIDTSHNPSIYNPGDLTFTYQNAIKAVNSSNTWYWYFNVIIYKCSEGCTTCTTYNSSAVPPRGICTACGSGYEISGEDCIEK